MLEAVGGGGGAGDLERGLGALTDFQKKVLGLLSDLEGGDASGTKVAEATVTRASFGTGGSFAEADGFYEQYQRVHQAVLSLSKQLSDEIELLRIAVRGADVGFDNLEEDLRLKFHSIKARLDKERDGQAQVQGETNDSQTGTTDLR
ncbi:hypothetical protein ACWGJT_06495 [Streptomyces xantholiticus]|uniref:Uncharacterized protein n=1 Tax=Streptomyces xantholiticus TaxID=68285 RepID=A0ABV1V4J9_9ACTN